MTENQLTCPKCNSPVKPGMKFCESCGARIEAPASCPACGASVSPNSKFCESCGATIAPATAPATVAATAAVPAAPAPARKAAEKNDEAKVESKSVTTPDTTVKEPAGPVKPAAPVTGGGGKAQSSRTTLILAGVVILALLGAAIWFVGLPMISGSGGAPVSFGVPSVPGTAAAGTAPAGTSPSDPSSSSPPAAAAVSFTTGPTQEIPAATLVKFSAARDPITGIVTITFDGGAGRYGVKTVDIRLSRSDGQIIANTYTLKDFGNDGLTLQGTKTGDDRLELTVNFSNGEHYKIIDQIFEYKRRNW